MSLTRMSSVFLLAVPLLLLGACDRHHHFRADDSYSYRGSRHGDYDRHDYDHRDRRDDDCRFCDSRDGRSFSRLDGLIDQLLYARKDNDREDAAKDLGRLGDPRAIPALRQAALRDRADDVREAARKAIERIDPHARYRY